MPTPLIIFKTKYGEQIYLAATPEQRAQVFDTVLRARFAEGYWYYKPEPPRALTPQEESLLLVTEEALEALPKNVQNSMRAERLKVVRTKETRQKRYQADLEEWERLTEYVALPPEEAVSKVWTSPRGRTVGLAEYIMEGRQDYEYEGWSEEETLN